MPYKTSNANQFSLASAEKLASFDALDTLSASLLAQFGIRFYNIKVLGRKTSGDLDETLTRRDATALFMGVTSIPMEIVVDIQTLGQAYAYGVNAGELMAKWGEVEHGAIRQEAEYEFFTWLFGSGFDYGRFLLNICTWKAA